MAPSVNQELTIQIAPHCSLQPRGAVVFFVSICIVSFTIAGFLATRGMWPVLPFAGLEMLALAWALRLSMRRRLYSQTIRLTEELVRVETRIGQRSHQIEFTRHWARVKLRDADFRLHPTRLVIESHGQACEVGGFLNEEERRALAVQLMRSIGRVNESPPLTSA